MMIFGYPRFMWVLICTAFFMQPITLPAKGEDKALTKKGQQIAEKLCARCHAIGKKGESPLKEAPPFRTFAAKWPTESLEEALAEGIVVGHEAMPEFQFQPDEIGAFLAYLKILSGKQ